MISIGSHIVIISRQETNSLLRKFIEDKWDFKIKRKLEWYSLPSYHNPDSIPKHKKNNERTSWIKSTCTITKIKTDILKLQKHLQQNRKEKFAIICENRQWHNKVAY